MSSLSHTYDVIILGAGASGLFCAFTAARRGRRVLVLEKANKVGKKILMSGGGRCNFTNHQVEARHYISANPHFCKSALKRFTQWDFIAMVEAHGIAYEERKHSQLFCKDSAKAILDMLLCECQLAGVSIKTHCDLSLIVPLPPTPAAEPQDSNHTRPRYEVRFSQGHDQHRLSCQSLVVATGALSIPTLGGSGMGYDIAAQFGIPTTPRRAGLVPLMFSDGMKPLCERLAGLALDVSIECNDQCFRENLLFTHRGISGPVVLQISNYWAPGDSLLLNLLPDLDAPAWLHAAKATAKRSLLRTFLSQTLAKGLVNELQALWWPEMAEKPLAEFSDAQLTAIGQNLNQWRLKPSASEGYRTAEVTLGGVDTHAISSRTMEAMAQPGLYFVGEVLDVSGHLGGYNFQWAWSSGHAAGCFA